MAAGTISSEVGPVHGLNHMNPRAYFVEQEIDIAALVASKGGVLEAGEIVQCITVDADAVILTAGFEMIVSVDATADGNTVNLGVTGGDVDAYVAVFDIDDDSSALTAGVGHATMAATAADPVIISAADTIDWELQATTTAPITGKFRVWALLLNIASVGSDKTASEVVRDQVA